MSRRLRYRVTGVVQGVGFRPFVHRLATELGLSGFVGNDALEVFAEIQGDDAALAAFDARLRDEAPPLALVTSVDRREIPPEAGEEFAIVPSAGGSGARTFVSPDVATCEDCVRELFDPRDRRYRHPFITCTNCGPRFTIIRDLPYDRPATTMAGFPMCAACAAEYADPTDRRFHAQPIACADCGPQLRFTESLDAGATAADDEAIGAAQQALHDGKIVAVKGIGGYHLAARADDPGAVARLRERKARAQKAFAVMARDLPAARKLADIDADEERVLTRPARPIVLLRRRPGALLCAEVAPDNPLVGVLLPYTPVHHLLLADTGLPALVMTSANVSDEPLCFDDTDAAVRLPLLADAVLTHDRPIHVPCDDSVVRVVDGTELPIRRSRGFAPLPVPLGRPLPATLAVGAEVKNTCCLVDGDNAFCSAHIGDMGSPQTTRAFERAVDQMTTLHRLIPETIAADAHPGYLTRAWAERHTGEPGEPGLELVQHHHAHVVALLAEHGRLGEPIIGFAFDGTGYGDDASVWGGEVLVIGADPTAYDRAGHLSPVLLPGGDAAVRNPCRMALAYLHGAGIPWDDDLPAVAACSPQERQVVRSQLDSGTGTVRCTSMGRLFDGIASLLGVRHRIGYEAQAAIELEILAGKGDPGRAPPLSLPVREDGVIDQAALIAEIISFIRTGASPADQAYGFHRGVAEAVADCADRIAQHTGIRSVGLTGGVFQNVLLVRACRQRLRERGLDVLTHRLVPPNDGSLALGQAVVAAMRADSGAVYRR